METQSAAEAAGAWSGRAPSDSVTKRITMMITAESGERILKRADMGNPSGSIRHRARTRSDAFPLRGTAATPTIRRNHDHFDVDPETSEPGRLRRGLRPADPRRVGVRSPGGEPSRGQPSRRTHLDRPRRARSDSLAGQGCGDG